MASSGTLVTNSEIKKEDEDANHSTLSNDDGQEGKVDPGNTRHLYRYHHTRMVSNLADVADFVDPLDESNIFDSETLFHYCNLIMDQFDKEVLTLALFRDDLNYGPKGKPIDIHFHPFEWKNKWHLAIGFVKYEKILLVHCSNYTLSDDEEAIKRYPSFGNKTLIRIHDFVIFFNQKLSKNSLKYPRLYTDMFKPASGSSAINLLTIIFAFCLDPVSLTRSFCDPLFSPTKFDISDFHPIIAKIDKDFREQQQQENEEKRKEKLLMEKKLAEEKRNALKELKRKEKKEREEREKEQLEAQLKERQRMLQERISLENEEHEKRVRERQERQQHHDTAIDTVSLTHIDNNEIETKVEKLPDSNKGKREQENGAKSEIMVKRPKTRAKLGNTISTPIDINDLEDSDDASEDEGKVPLKSRSITASGTEDVLRRIFLPVYGIEFKKYILHSELFANTDKIDQMYKFIRQFSYDQPLNALLFKDEATDKGRKNEFDIRKSLIVTYKRRMKQEFDESKFEKIMETDSLNQIIPLIFENGSIFLINIKTSDKFNCIVKLICITNRSNRSEREILKNYAFRRLIEMYVAKYNRLVIKIRTSIITIKQPEFYKVAMASFCVLQRMLSKNKLNLAYKPRLENLESYNVYFQKMMEGVEMGDMLATELNFRRIVKYSLTD